MHRLPIIEECLRALADCKVAEAETTLISPPMERMTRDELQVCTKHELARRLAVLLIDDAEITEGVVWANDPGSPPNETDTRFKARTVVMKASTYHTLCQALRNLRTEALEDNFAITP